MAAWATIVTKALGTTAKNAGHLSSGISAVVSAFEVIHAYRAKKRSEQRDMLSKKELEEVIIKARAELLKKTNDLLAFEKLYAALHGEES